MLRKNIANDRLKNLRNSLVQDREKPRNPKHLVPDTKTLPIKNTTITNSTSREKKRKCVDTPEDQISKRYKTANSDPISSFRSEFQNEMKGSLKRSSQQVGCEYDKTPKFEMRGQSGLSRNKSLWKSNTSISQRLSKYKDKGHRLSQGTTDGQYNLENEAKSSSVPQQRNLEEPVDEDVHMLECDSVPVTSCFEDKATDAPNFEPIGFKTEDGDNKSEDVCIVVDTNIFMAHLRIVKDIVNMPVSGSIKPLMYVPWMVLTELDFMKDGSNPGRSAQKAINYINSLLEAENCRIKCQTVFEANEQICVGKSPDDKIISCCLQISKQFKTVILLSNDVNARNKALIHGIGTSSFNEIMVKLHGLLQKNKKFAKILHKMTVVCSYAICDCAKDAYGDVWTKMDLLNNRPWSLTDCLKIFKKYWMSVFGDKLLKQFQVAVMDLLNLLENKSNLADDSDDFKSFTAVCGAICFFLKDVESLRAMMEKTIKEIKDIKNS